MGFEPSGSNRNLEDRKLLSGFIKTGSPKDYYGKWESERIDDSTPKGEWIESD